MFVIVYGALRSGTTLLRLMLDMHPGLSCPGETDFIFDYSTIAPDGTVQIAAEALARDRIYQRSETAYDPAFEGRAAVSEMIGKLHQVDGDTVVLMLHRGIETALALFPDTPVLHMLRDPRDVARSSIGMGWAGTVYHGAGHWIETEEEWDRARAAHPGMTQAELRYEQLILTPEAELRRVAEFFGVPFRPEMLDYADSSTYAAPDTTLIEQWKRKQTAEELALVEGRLGPLLTDRGYAPSGHPPRQPDAWARTQMLWQNKSAIWRQRIARFGLVDPVLVGLGRVLGWPQIGYGAQARIDAKTETMLK